MTPRPPCRLFVLMAREAHRAVILRRGPSKRVQLILWHTDTDTFVPGQWLKGRIYEHRSDLSPDGRYFIYFAAKHKGPFDSWTAISKPPYLTALVLWPKGDCWDGGGLFESRTHLWLNHPSAERDPNNGSLPKNWTLRCNDYICGGEDRPVETVRLKRDGWQTLQELSFSKIYKKREFPSIKDLIAELERNPQMTECQKELLKRYQALAGGVEIPDSYVSGYKTLKREVLSKRLNAELAIEAHHGTSRFEKESAYFVLTSGEPPRQIQNATWIDFDQNGRVIFTRDGGIWEATVDRHGGIDERLIRHFNDHIFEGLPAPEEAKRW